MFPLSEAMQQEHDFAKIIAQQQINGWEFDFHRAQALHEELEVRKQEILDEVRPYLHHELVHDKYVPVPNPWLKCGSRYQKRVSDYWGESVNQVQGPYHPVVFLEPSLDSRQKLMKQLAYHGWKPVNYTDKGNPKLDEESMEGVELGGAGDHLMEFFKARQRSSTLLNDKGGWLRHAYKVAEDRWRISAGVNTIGTNTHRCTHNVVVNVPASAPHIYYGRQLRELFIASPGKVILGADASQVELRCLASYMGDKDLIKEVCEGDFHTLVWKAIDEYVETRNHTKNVEYGLIYGASDTKLGSMADNNPKRLPPQKLGKIIRTKIMQALPAMSNVIEVVQQASLRGYIVGIDGFPVYMRKNKDGGILKHKALNTLLQHCGSMVVKRATIYLHEHAKDIDFKQVGHFHDEVQLECNPEDAETLGGLFIEGLEYAGQSYGLACPMTGEFKIGDTWAETH